ncbi:MAG: peptidylprolyl isomerase [Pirellulales bacterium]
MSGKHVTSARGAAMGRHWFQVAAGGAAVIAVCLAARAWWPHDSASAQKTDISAAADAAGAARAKGAGGTPEVVAVVNGESIKRQELATQCLRYHGKDVLESLVNKELILDHCQKRKIEVTDAEIDAEIARLAKRFALPVDEWQRMLQKERGISPEQYRRDIIWPTLALRRLAADRLQVTRQELDQAFESEYGPRVKVRMIGIEKDAAKAKQIHAQAVANPEEFGKLARKYSDDPESAAANGWIQPVRKHVGDKKIEKTAFSLKHGEVSPLIQVQNQYIILLCEGQVPAANVTREDVVPRLEELIRDRKLRQEATDLFASLQKTAKVVNVLNDPKLKQQMPGVAATINGRKVTIQQLSEECIARNGRDTLKGMINRRMIDRALRQKQLTVTQEAIDEELAEVAARMVPLKQGKPDVEEWLRQVTSEPGVTADLYVHDAIWPSVALKLLVKTTLKITDEDMKKGFEANYGPRVKCRAIVLDDMRQAKKVWEMARRNPTVEYFGKLAEEYSTDAASRATKGEIHPIAMHSGRPALEEAAFELRDGELSGIVQTEGKFVILLCEGRTQPNRIEMKEVYNLLREHIYRQKLNAAMGQQFEHLQKFATVTNHLDHTSHAPEEPKTRTAARTATKPATVTK